MKDIRVVESIHGTWYYHLAREGEYKALCGDTVMNCHMKLEDWGFVGHLNERYCSECKELADAGIRLPVAP